MQPGNCARASLPGATEVDVSDWIGTAGNGWSGATAPGAEGPGRDAWVLLAAFRESTRPGLAAADHTVA
jgi:hypothetical protein